MRGKLTIEFEVDDKFLTTKDGQDEIRACLRQWFRGCQDLAYEIPSFDEHGTVVSAQIDAPMPEPK